MDDRDLPSAFAIGSTDGIGPMSRASAAAADNAYVAVFWTAEHAGATASHAAPGATSAPPCAAEPTSERASDRCASGALFADEGMDVDEADTTDGGDTDGVDTLAPSDSEWTLLRLATTIQMTTRAIWTTRSERNGRYAVAARETAHGADDSREPQAASARASGPATLAARLARSMRVRPLLQQTVLSPQ